MHFGFALDSWSIDLWDVDLLDTDLDLLVGHSLIQTSPVNILFVSRTSSRRLQQNNCSSSKTSRRRICKASSSCLRWRKIVMLKTCWRRFQCMSWRCLQDVLKINKFLLGYIVLPYLDTSFSGSKIRHLFVYGLTIFINLHLLDAKLPIMANFAITL